MPAHATGRQAITTRFLGPTNHRAARIVASCEAGKVTVPWDYSKNTGDNHAAACEALAAKLGWQGDWTGAGVGGSGYAFVPVDYTTAGRAFYEGRGPA